jgi:ribosome modulation factor
LYGFVHFPTPEQLMYQELSTGHLVTGREAIPLTNFSKRGLPMAKSSEQKQTEGYSNGVSGKDKDGGLFQGFWDNIEESRARNEGYQEGKRDRAYIEEVSKSSKK